MGISSNILLSSKKYRKQRDYWIDLLYDLERERILVSYKGTSNEAPQSDKRSEVTYLIGPTSASRVNKIAKDMDEIEYIIVMSVFIVFLYKYTGKEDLFFIAPVYRKTDEMLINNIQVFRQRLSEEKSFRDVLSALKEQFIIAYENRDYPMDEIIKELNQVKDDHYDFFYDLAVASMHIHDLDSIPLEKISLLVVYQRWADTLKLIFKYNEAVFHRNDVECYVKYFNRVLEQAAADITVRLSDIELLSPEEKHRLLVEFNDTHFDYPEDKTIQQLFEAQAAIMPDNVAVLGPNPACSLTSKELNKRANQLAHYLQDRGVAAGVIVGIFIERSLEMIIGILGILKAGAAYLPIDPDTPGSRNLAILEDSRTSVLLSSSETSPINVIHPSLGKFPGQIEPFFTPSRPNIANLDKLSFIDRSYVDYEKYNRYIGLTMVKNSITMQATRGCPYDCAYCYKIWSKCHVFRSAENIFAEVKLYYDMGIKRFSFIDDVFNLNVPNSRRFFELIIENNLDVQIFFPAGLRGDILTFDYIDLMVKAGTVNIALALETASPRLQKLIKKNLDIKKLEENIRYICETYPSLILDLFIMHGLPSETEEEAMQTLDFVKRLKWIHFPIINILKIYQDTDMEKLALQCGITREAIMNSEKLAWHELPETLPFDKNFTLMFQTKFLYEYFLSKERLLHVLPYQMKLLAEDEILQRYRNYLPITINSFTDLLEFIGISKEELTVSDFADENDIAVPGLNHKLRSFFSTKKPGKDALKILLLDISQFFSISEKSHYDPVEPPLGLMYLMTYLDRLFGGKINGRIAKPAIDFDSFDELKMLLKEFDPHVIGLRTFTYYKDFFHETVAMIRRWGIDVPVIAGGPYATNTPGLVLRDPNIDLVVLGEGEITFAEVIEKIMQYNRRLPGEEVLKQVPGLAFAPAHSKLPKEKFPDTFVIDELTHVLSKESSDNLESINKPGDLAYIIYTSGSTGKPRGVMIQHSSVVNLALSQARYFNIRENERILQFSPFYFDASVEQIFMALSSGAVLNLVGKDILVDMDAFAAFTAKCGITHIHAVPTFLSNISIEKYGGLKRVIAGGDTCPFSLAERFNKDWSFYNEYGPTETTVTSIEFHVDSLLEGAGQVSVGKPIANTSVYIVDRHNDLKPPGVTGELIIGGSGVARGYLNNPELTAEKFVENTLLIGNKPGMLFRTGDFARWLPDGSIEFLGRIDNQVKIRGFRIELGEIESIMLTHNEIEDVVVSVRGNNNSDKYLCAYFVSNRELDVNELRDYLFMRCPPYMVPSHFTRLEQLPLNPNGKVDKRALPDPGGGDHGRLSGYKAPRDRLEQQLVEIWEKVLQRESIGIEDNFFMVGGDSIKTIQILSRVQKLGYKLEMKDIFQHPTISELSSRVKKLDREADQSVIKGNIPLTPIQKRFFLKGKAAPHHFNQSVMLYKEDGFEKEAVEAVFRKIQEHHDALRMTFMAKGEEIIQINNGLEQPLSLQVYNFRGGKDALHFLKEIVEQTQAGINLETGSLMQLRLFNMDNGDYLLIVLHHLVIDGISWRILFEDIEILFNRYKNREQLTLPLKTDSFKLWSEKLTEYARSRSFLKEQSYWSGIEATDVKQIERDFAGANNLEDEYTLSFGLMKEETDDLLTKVNYAFGTEINDILLTGLGLAVKETFGNDKLLVALEGHGREDVIRGMDINRTIGWFTSVFPVILDMSYSDDLSRQIKEVKESLHRIPNKGVGYGILKYLTPADQRPGVKFKLTPQLSFNYLGQFDADVGSKSFRLVNELAGNPVSQKNSREYDLIINGMIVDHRLIMNIIYSKNHFKQGTIERLLNNYKDRLRHVLSFCASRKERELTPSDLTYKELSIDYLDALKGKYSIADIYRLSPMQEGMLFHSLYDKNSAAYFEQISYRFKGKWDITKMKKSLNELIKRYDIFRTAFIYEDVHYPLQVVLKERGIEFLFKDIQRVTNVEEREKCVREFKEKDKRRNFNLHEDALIRVSLLRLGETEYEFIWSFHHILMDGWCVGIVILEFIEIYNSYLEERPVRLPGTKQYKEYMRWLQNQDMEVSREYWETYLAGYEEKTSLANTGAIRRQEQYYKNDFVYLLFDRERTASLDLIIGKSNVTLNTVIQAIWGMLLSRYTRRKDVVFGAVVSGRPAEIEGIESMIGLFINTIPVRIRCHEGITFAELLQYVQAAAVESEPYHYYTLADIQANSSLKQDLLDHIIVFENYPVAEKLEGLGGEREMSRSIEKLEIANIEIFEQSNYDLNILVSKGSQVLMRFGFNTFAYEKEFIERIKDHYDYLIKQIIADDKKLVEEYSLLTEEEKRRLIYDFNDNRTEIPADKTVPGLFEEQAVQLPDHVAVIFDDKKLTYRVLNESSNRLARELKLKGVKAGIIVGLMVDRSLEMLIGNMAILKAGGAYLPIEIDYPKERKKYMLKDCNSEIVLTRKKNMKHISEASLLVIIEEHIRCGHIASNLEPICDPADIIYVIYTSGSTGKPKGVLTTHYNVIRVVKNTNYITLAPSDRILQLSNYAFDGSVFDIYGAILNGASLLMLREESIFALEKLSELIIKERISVFFVTTAMFNMLIDIEMECFGKVRRVLFGGERVSLEHSQKALNYMGSGRIIHVYGPTETTVYATYYFIDKIHESLCTIPIGSPISNTTAYILDENITPVSLGLIGEIGIGGDGVARGYLNNIEHTERLFKDNPFVPGDRLYLTGDLARSSPDGNIEFLGRKDHQVKIRGFRIELGEIEQQLLAIDSVQEVAVVEREDENGVKYICAYLVCDELRDRQETPIGFSGIKKILSETLPDYMIPSYFIQLEKMPLTRNGKIDRKALPEPEIGAGGEFVLPRDWIERKLVKIWSEVLNIDAKLIGITADFFELGGHSLKATMLVSKIYKELNIKVLIGQVFQHPTIMELSEDIKQGTAGKYASIYPVEEKEYYELSSAQKRLYIVHKIDPQSISYNLPCVLPVGENIKKDKLEAALNKLIERHESLRTFFKEINGVPVQRIHPGIVLNLDYYETSIEEVQEKINDYIRPFDLARAPLMRSGIIKIPGIKYVWIIDIHHIVSDGTSQAVLTGDFISLYNDKELKPLKLQYKDFSEWQNNVFKKGKIKSQEEYWLNLFSGEIPELFLPMDFDRPEIFTFAGDLYYFKINKDDAGELRKMTVAFGGTIFINLLAVLNVLLCKYSGQDDIIVGTGLAGRQHDDLRDIIGLFINPLPMRNFPKEEKSYGDFLREVIDNSIKAFENQDVQFEKLVDMLNLERNPSKNPLFSVVLNGLNLMQPGEKFSRPGREEVGQKEDFSLKKQHISAQTDMVFSIKEVGEEIYISVEYYTAIFKKETIISMVGGFLKIVKAIIADADIKLKDIEIFPANEKKYISSSILEMKNKIVESFDV